MMGSIILQDRYSKLYGVIHKCFTYVCIPLVHDVIFACLMSQLYICAHSYKGANDYFIPRTIESGHLRTLKKYGLVLYPAGVLLIYPSP